MTQDSTVRDGTPDAPAPIEPDSGYSREDYAIHATRSELPLFADAVAGRRNDAGWLSSLSGVLGRGAKDTTAATAQAALERRAGGPAAP